MARARRGENLVADRYRGEGWTVVERNWRCTRGELDIICERNGVLVVCEVKTRRNADFGHPFESVDSRKVQRLRRAVAAYLDARRSAGESVPSRVQFDGAAVIGDVVDVRRDVGNSL
jgi:putative endonuclease